MWNITKHGSWLYTRRTLYRAEPSPRWGPPLIGVDRCDTNIVAIFVHLLRFLSLSILVLYLFTQNLKFIEIPSKTYCSYYIYNKN